jgi:uncharacterized protein (DUF111 family)
LYYTKAFKGSVELLRLEQKIYSSAQAVAGIIGHVVLSSLVLGIEQDHVSDGIEDLTEGEYDIIDEGARVEQLNVAPDVDSHLFHATVAGLRDRIGIIEHVKEGPAYVKEVTFEGLVPH